MTVAAPRVTIDFVNELPNRRVAVTDNVGRFAISGSDQLVSDDQQTVIVARNVSFDNYPRAFIYRDFVSSRNLLLSSQIRGNTATVVAVERFHHNWSAQLLGGTPRVFDVGNGPSLRHGHASRLQ